MLAAAPAPDNIRAMRPFVIVLNCLLIPAAVAAAGALAVGDRLPAIAFTDQHDIEAAVGTDTRVVLFARDMEGAEIVEKALAEDGAGLLAEARAVFVSDIHRMPRIITRLFALPAMRRRPYRMLLDRDGTRTADFPAQKEKVSLMRLENLVIRSIEYVETPEQLRAALTAAAKQQPSGEGE